MRTRRLWQHGEQLSKPGKHTAQCSHLARLDSVEACSGLPATPWHHQKVFIDTANRCLSCWVRQVAARPGGGGAGRGCRRGRRGGVPESDALQLPDYQGNVGIVLLF